MTKDISRLISSIEPNKPVLIAGPTASGKSELALRIAEMQGGIVINADAIQVFENWRVLTARPSEQDEVRAKHALYGHVSGNTPYSVGDWLRDLEPFLVGGERPIIVGGTGLYFSALTEGLAQIPKTPPSIRNTAMATIAEHGHKTLGDELDSETKSRIDLANPMRVQRAWEVLQATGKGLAHWQDDTPPPRLPLSAAHPIVLNAPKEWLTPRIEKRFSIMVETGAMDEARFNQPHWSPELPSSKAIGAAELIAALEGEISLTTACERGTIFTRQFAKRQRSWFRSRMREWHQLDAQTAF